MANNSSQKRYASELKERAVKRVLDRGDLLPALYSRQHGNAD